MRFIISWMIRKFRNSKIENIPATIVKIGKKPISEEKLANASYEIDYAASNIVRKTHEITRTLEKYPKPTRKK